MKISNHPILNTLYSIHNTKDKSKGFTLIELLIVIAIIGILAAFVLTNLQGVRERARDARRKSDLNALKTSLRLYYNDQNAFPDSDSNGNIIGCGSTLTPCTWGTSSFAIGSTTYMNNLPLDPSASATNSISYTYQQVSDDSYILRATLENLSDQDISESQSRCTNTYSSLANADSATDYVVCE